MFGETESKYLAGLLDADGCLTYSYNNGYLSLTMCISMSESIDKDGKTAKYLSSKVGQLYTRKREENLAVQNEWTVRKRKDLEKLLPHIIKHMVVKGSQWSLMLETFREYKAVPITREKVLELREEASKCRGPKKPKIHPTWAWAAGYIDGDGWFLCRDRGNYIEKHVGAVAHADHTEGLELLHKAFGGVLKKDNKGYIRWIKNLGNRDIVFAKRFLKKMVNHSKLKKWKIEKILSTYPQRLTEDKS
ncbi:MAG: hypothetical protein ACQEWA_02645 [Sphaerochaetaceae bacterium]